MHSLTPKQSKRRQRYVRRPQNLPHTLTKRDAKILQAIDRYDTLTSEQMAQLFGLSRTAINKRLKLLFHHHYLGKLPASLSLKFFNSPDIYHIELSSKTTKILAQKSVPLPCLKSYQRKQPKRNHVQHTLLANDIMIAFELFAIAHPQHAFIEAHQLLIGGKRQNEIHPWKVPAFLPEHGKAYTVYPDAAFAMLHNETDKKQLFLVEADRMTEPQTRKNKKLFKVSNIKAKLLIYFTAWKQGLFRGEFGIAATCILFVTLSR